jgi:acetyl-CoA carboxylase carboxyl transferase beta subunit
MADRRVTIGHTRRPIPPRQASRFGRHGRCTGIRRVMAQVTTSSIYEWHPHRPTSGHRDATWAVDPEHRPSAHDSELLTCGACLNVSGATHIVAALKVCPECGYHLRLTARERLSCLVDASSFEEWDGDLTSVDSLRFVDELPYATRFQQAQSKSGEVDAIVTGRAAVSGQSAAIGVFEFGFMGGSMGSVVGERVSRLFFRARARRLPVLIVTASGGARMQEGTLSLMQMAKVSVAICAFKRSRLPYLTLLADPTTGGVAASLAMQGDVILAEPGAQIGFAGPRVIEQTIREQLPAGFQRAERLLERGLIDAVVPRAHQRPRIHDLLLALAPTGARP